MLVLYCIVCMCTVCMRYPRAETYAVIYIHTCMHTVCLTCMHAVCLLACRTNVGMHTVHICHHMLHAIQKSGIWDLMWTRWSCQSTLYFYRHLQVRTALSQHNSDSQIVPDGIFFRLSTREDCSILQGFFLFAGLFYLPASFWLEWLCLNWVIDVWDADPVCKHIQPCQAYPEKHA